MIFFIKSRKGQSALEFLVLIGFSLLLISALLIIFQNNIEDMNTDRETILIDQMYNLVLSEIDFAIMSRPVYNRTFFLPGNLGGHNYTIEVVDDREIVLTYLNDKHVRFLREDYNIVGNFSSGINTLVKYKNETITLN